MIILFKYCIDVKNCTNFIYIYIYIYDAIPDAQKP